MTNLWLHVLANEYFRNVSKNLFFMTILSLMVFISRSIIQYETIRLRRSAYSDVNQSIFKSMVFLLATKKIIPANKLIYIT